MEVNNSIVKMEEWSIEKHRFYERNTQYKNNFFNWSPRGRTLWRDWITELIKFPLIPRERYVPVARAEKGR